MKHPICDNEACAEFQVVKNGIDGQVSIVICGACNEPCEMTDTEPANAYPAN